MVQKNIHNFGDSTKFQLCGPKIFLKRQEKMPWSVCNGKSNLAVDVHQEKRREGGRGMEGGREGGVGEETKDVARTINLCPCRG